MKARFLALSLALLLGVGLTACGRRTTNQTTPNNSNQTTVTEQSGTTAENDTLNPDNTAPENGSASGVTPEVGGAYGEEYNADDHGAVSDEENRSTVYEEEPNDSNARTAMDDAADDARDVLDNTGDAIGNAVRGTADAIGDAAEDVTDGARHVVTPDNDAPAQG
jgi:hypothetical protein